MMERYKLFVQLLRFFIKLYSWFLLNSLNIMWKFIKVSLYGHSLGSVLSYDILCHQENLTSPFPMDWMYKEYSRSEESSLDTKRGMSTNLEDNISNVVKEAKKIVDPVEEKMMSARSTLVHENGLSDEFSTILSPIASELVGAASDSNFKQIRGKESPHEFVCDSSDVLSQERDHLCEAKEMKLDDPMSGVENRAVEGSENAGNKEKEINMLMKEVCILGYLYSLEFIQIGFQYVTLYVLDCRLIP